MKLIKKYIYIELVFKILILYNYIMYIPENKSAPGFFYESME